MALNGLSMADHEVHARGLAGSRVYVLSLRNADGMGGTQREFRMAHASNSVPAVYSGAGDFTRVAGFFLNVAN
jgi:hypothetical protein